MKISVNITLSCLILLSGCSTLSEQECRHADWQRLGVRDGQQGKFVGLLDEHIKSCTQYGVRPDERQYLAGREAGLQQYCQLGNAFRIGMNGEAYTGVCPLDVDAKFRRNNVAALEVYNSKRKMEDIYYQLSRKERELAEKNMPEKERTHLREEIRELDRKRDRLRSDLYYQEQELSHLMNKMNYRSERR